MDKQEEEYVFPFFSKKPILPKWRDIPWIVFVLAVLWGFQYTPLGKLEMSSRWAGPVIICVAIGVFGVALAVLQITCKIFPVSKNTADEK